MSEKLLYLDSSALVKLVVRERESPALVELLAEWPNRVTSAIASVEVVRAARYASSDAVVHRRAHEVMAAVNLLSVATGVLNAAAHLDPPSLRSIDAIHLAAALSLGADLGAFVAYDERLVDAARRLGLAVLAPS